MEQPGQLKLANPNRRIHSCQKSPSTETTDQPQPEPAIELSDGTLLPFLTATEFSPKTIAHALAMACRFGNQCKVFYSVGQHSILVSKLMARLGGDPLEGLLHDAAEFVVCDLATPLKKACPEYNHMEKDLQRRINLNFNLPGKKTHECERADKIAMFIEAYDLLLSRGTNMEDVLGVREEALQLRPEFEIWYTPMPWDLAKRWWLHTYKELTCDSD